jgi:hypothetical protein
MYLYYILGFKLFGAYEADKMLLEEMEKESSTSKVRQRKKNKAKKKERSRSIKSDHTFTAYFTSYKLGSLSVCVCVFNNKP